MDGMYAPPPGGAAGGATCAGVNIAIGGVAVVGGGAPYPPPPMSRGLHSFPSELNLSTFRPHPRVSLGYVEDKVSLS
jgi:hypothetical protein